MARKRNQVATVSITISTTPAVAAYLDDLVQTGLYGKTPSEAAERLVSRGLERLIHEGKLGTGRRRSARSS